MKTNSDTRAFLRAAVLHGGGADASAREMEPPGAYAGSRRSRHWWKEGFDSRLLITALALLVTAINAIVLMAQAREEKRVVLEAAALGNVREATAFEQYASRTIEVADTATRFLMDEFRKSGARIDLAQMFADGTIDPQLFRAATIIAPDGTTLVSSEGHPDAARFAVVRRDGLAAPEAASGDVQVGQPIPASEGHGQTIPFFRRLVLPGGGFAGIVVLEMAPAHFLDFDAKAARRSNDVIALIGLDRIVRARRAGQNFTSGENVADAAQFQPGAGVTGNFVAASPIDGIRRLFHVRRVPGYPLTVIAGVREEDALADVAARTKVYYVFTLVLTGIILLLTAFAIGALTRGKRAFTQLRASEATLRGHERELRTLTESMPQLVWITEPDGRHSYFNQQWVDYTGLSVEQSIAGWETAFDPAEQQGALSRWREAVATGAVYEAQYRLRRADGAYRWMLARALPLRDGQGRITKWFGTSTDIDDQVIARAKLREQTDLLDLTRDAMIVRRADDTIGFWNRGAERMYGWKAEEVLGVRAHEFADADSSKVLAAKKHLAEFGEWSGEVEHLRKDGSTVIVSSRWTAVPNERKTDASVLIVNTDLTEQKKLEQQLLRNQRLESIGTLASGVAHDLNNILAPILMAAPLLRNEIPAERRSQLVGILEQSAERGAAIVRQVLTFARGADGERVLLQPIYALKEVAQIVTDTFPKSINVQTKCPDDLSLIEADPTQLHQVLLNLCVNARDAMPEGGTLSLSAEDFEVDDHYAAMTPGAKPGPHLLIKVSDTGTGIRPDLMDKIFDPFFTTKGVGQGTGLGLSTVLGIVRDHRGTIQVESDGRGTTFRVLFPAATTPVDASAPAAPIDLPHGQGETILVVDDEDAIRAVAQPLLRKHGYEVMLAANGPAALALYAQHSATIALVLTDLAMPIMNGIALARTLRKMQPTARIVISAGREEDCDAAEMAEIGVAATLPKPYTQATLLRLLDQLLSPHRSHL